MYFFDVMQPIELLPNIYVGLSRTAYYQHRFSLEPQETQGWFLVTKALHLPAGEALGLARLPKPALRAGLRPWFSVEEEAKGISQSAGIYVAVEPTILPVGTQVQLTTEKAFAWQFYLTALGSALFEVRKALPCAPGEWVCCPAGMTSLPPTMAAIECERFCKSE